MADEVLKYSDIIRPDNSLEDLIAQMAEVIRVNKDMVSVLSNGADKVSKSMGTMSGATQQGRQAIDEAARTAERLQKAYDSLTTIINDTDRQMSSVRNRLLSLNGATDTQKKDIERLAGAYAKLKGDMAGLASSYEKLLSSGKAEGWWGDKMLQNVQKYERDIKSLNAELGSQAKALLQVQQAQERYNYSQSEEARIVEGLNQRTKEVIDGRKREAKANEQAAAAVLKLAEAKRINATASRDSEDYTARVLAENEREIQIAELQKKINAEKIGSYNRLSLEYQKVKIQLNAMSAAERETTDSGKKLEEEAMQLYTKMQMLQEATGKHTLSVGNYGKGFDMLRFEVNQVMRELPSLAVSLNQFFLAISNNIPMVVDQIQRANRVNAVLRQEGKKTVAVGKQVVAAILSWQTALVVGLTLLSKYGKNIVAWAKRLIEGRSAVMKLKDALKEVNKELENTDGGYADNIVSLLKLRESWLKLKTEVEKSDFLKEHQEDFKKLGGAVTDVNTAEEILVRNTRAVITAYAQRAQAAAASELTKKQFKKAIQASAEQATLRRNIAEKRHVSDEDLRNEEERILIENLVKEENYGYKFKDKSEFLALYQKKKNFDKLKKAKNLSTSEGNNIVIPDDKDINALMYSAGLTKEQLSAVDKVLQDLEKIYGGSVDAAIGFMQDEERNLQEAYQFLAIAAGLEDDADALLKKMGFGTKGKKQKDITEAENAMDRKVAAGFDTSETNLINVKYEKAVKAKIDAADKQIHEWQDIIEKNNKWLSQLATGEVTITPDIQAKMAEIKADNEKAAQIILNVRKKLAQDLEDLEIQRAIDEQKLELKNLQNRLAAAKKGSKEEYELKQEILRGEENVEVWETMLNRDETMQEDILAVNRKYLEKNKQLEYEWQMSELKFFRSVLETKLNAVSDSEQILREALEGQIIELNRQIAQLENAQLAPERRQSTSAIDADYARQQRLLQGKSLLADFQRGQSLSKSRYSMGETSGRKGGPGWKPNEYKQKRFNLNQQKEEIEYKLTLGEQGLLELTPEQKKELEAQLEGVVTDLKKSGPASSFADHGLFGGILEQMGLNHEQIDAMNAAKDVIIDALNEIAEAEVEAAQKAVDAQQERVDAAQNAYEAEVQARANGYANNVATAKKEMEAEKKRLAQKQKLLEQAERRKEALDSLSQVSSLVTATAQIWQAFSGIGPWGIALAAVATAGMFSAFIASKVKAKQVASAEYGEGGLEFLEGGSHASGDDIDLGTRNRKGRRMRAEGGEAMAIINKRQTRRYRKALPGIIDSLNKGVFEEKYLKVFDGAQGISLQQNNTAQVDLSRLERDVQGIRKAGEERSYMMPDGTLVVQRGNVKRYIRR